MVAVPRVAPGSHREVSLCSYRSTSKKLPFSNSHHSSHVLLSSLCPFCHFFPSSKKWMGIVSRGITLESQNKRQASLLAHTLTESRGFPGLSASLPLALFSGLALAAAMLLFINQGGSCGRPRLATCPQLSAECSKHYWEHKSWPSDSIDSYSGRKKKKGRRAMYQEKKNFLALLLKSIAHHQLMLVGELTIWPCQTHLPYYVCFEAQM